MSRTRQAGSAGIVEGARLARIAAAILIALTPGCLLGATPPNTAVTNTATAHYAVGGVALTATGSVTVTTVGRTRSSLQLLQYVSPAAQPMGFAIAVAQVDCSTSGSGAGPFVPLSGPTPIGGGTLAVPGNVRLAPTGYYGDGEPVFIQVTDFDQNRDPNVAETILVSVTTSTGDTELLRLTETGLSTGVFVGYVQTTTARTLVNDCKLSVAAGATVTVSYADAASPNDRSSAVALIDPFGTVFDSSTGGPINGAAVTLINAATAQAAVVLCDDGVTPYPATVVTGESFAACGGTVSWPAGRYRFPRVPAGDYRLKIVSPAGYKAPSLVSTPALQTLPGAPFDLTTGSRGETFQILADTPVRLDIPLDPSGGSLQINKTADLAVVGVGDFLPYTLTLRNSGTLSVVDANIIDYLPAGFRFQSGSARLNGAAAPNPSIAPDGRTLRFAVGTIASGATATLTYVVQVTAGAQIGNADNIAGAAAPLTSNMARATVAVREDLFQSHAILTGRVIVGPCTDDAPVTALGLGKARIVLEDGRYVLTDKEGLWHLDNITPGTHVVQLDLDSLPSDYEALECEHNDRFAGRPYSQFVNVRGGTLWRADFYVAKKRPRTAEIASPAPSAAVTAVPASAHDPPAVPVPIAREHRIGQIVEELPYDASWLASAPPGVEWLHPQQDFQPALPAIKVALRHHPKDVVELRVNGATVSALNYDGMLVNAARTVALSTWSGVNIEEGDNLLELRVRDARGSTLKEERRTIHYASRPVRVLFDPKRSRLVADGKTPPVIAVRMLDKDGHPARRGVLGDFQINEPYQANDTLQAIEREPLAGRLGGKPRFEVLDDGTALIELAPTTKAGEVVLGFAFGDAQRQEIRTWLVPAAREWILVGFAAGTVGHKTLSGNMEALQAADADQTLFDEDRIAFYAKGRIKGGYLLTIAYDSAKARGTPLSNTLKQSIDPNQYYTLYADGTDPQFDAASTRKLYLRIERAHFYALFGDFDTGLTVTELARYSRTVTGAKSEFEGKLFGYNAFATRTSQAYIRDEIPGDGTSGLYRLSQSNIVINSDKVHIETRDRFQSEVIIETRNLTPYLDYDIDPVLGTVLFKEPIPVRDGDFNPIFIVAEYETQNSSDERLTYGGRGAFKPVSSLEIGLTEIHEGNVGASGKLRGADLTYKPDGKTTLKGEFARSARSVAARDTRGDAWLLEAVHRDDRFSAKIYDRERDLGYGLGQQSNSQTGVRELGADARYKPFDTVTWNGKAYHEDVLSTGERRLLAESDVQLREGGLIAQLGLRSVKDEDGSGQVSASNQALAGASYELPGQRLKLRANAEQALGRAESIDFPNRYRVGADYKLSALTTLFTTQEFDRGDKLSTDLLRIGLRTTPWSGAQLQSAIGDQVSNDSTRLYSSLGLTQKWQIDKHWQADFSVDRGETVKDEGASPFNTNVTPASGPLSGAYTAFAVGTGYSNRDWSGNGRIERRISDTGDRFNLLLHLDRKLDQGTSVAAGIIYTDTTMMTSTTRNLDARAGFARRPADSPWIWLDRLDFITQTLANPSGESSAHKVVNNLNLNYRLSRQTQWSFQYGEKYVFDRIGGTDYDGFTDLLGLEARHDLSAKWDIGASGATLHSWSSRTMGYCLGVSVGHELMGNAWVALGYNVLGFNDKDFGASDYHARGVYLSVRAKFDQDTLGLNNPSAGSGARP